MLPTGRRPRTSLCLWHTRIGKATTQGDYHTSSVGRRLSGVQALPEAFRGAKGKLSPASRLQGRQMQHDTRQGQHTHSSFSHSLFSNHSPAQPSYMRLEHDTPSLKTWDPLCLLWRGERQAPGVHLPPRHRLQPQEDTMSPQQGCRFWAGPQVDKTHVNPAWFSMLVLSTPRVINTVH